MHLEHEPGTAALVAEPAVDADHRHFDDVGVRALHDEVDREPLAQRPGLAALGPDLRNRPAPAEQAGHVAVSGCLFDRAERSAQVATMVGR